MAYQLSSDISLFQFRTDFRLQRNAIVLLQVVKQVSPTMVLVQEGPYNGICMLRDRENLLEKAFYLFRINSFETNFKLVVDHIGSQGVEMLHYQIADFNHNPSDNQYLTANGYLVSAYTKSEEAIIQALRANVFSRPRREVNQYRSENRKFSRNKKSTSDADTSDIQGDRS